MNPPLTSRSTVIKRGLIVAGIAVVGLCIYVLATSIMYARTTGTLHVNSSNPKATLSISQTNHQAELIGVGSATIHLSPGAYQVSANYGTGQTNATVLVNKKHTTTVFLELKSKPPLPSVANINFSNIDTLIDSGLTTTQIGILKQDFFQYKQTAQKVSVVPSSVSPGPHDPNTSTSFTLNFGVLIDSAPYNASASYSDLSNIRLLLYNPSNKALVFDSYAVNAKPTE
jgi:hypothetical protein